MKYLKWLKANINMISFIVGIAFVTGGNTEVGRILIEHGQGL